MLAVIGAINGVAPVAAPVVGGLVTGTIGWKGIFVILLFIGVLLWIGCIRFKESLPVEKRSKTGIVSTFRNFGAIVHNPVTCSMFCNWRLHKASSLLT